MTKKIAKNVALFSLVAILTASCNLDYFADAELSEFTWNPSLAIPIGEISYSVSELFSEISNSGVEIGTDDNNIVLLTYEQQLQSQKARSFLSLINQNFNESLQGGLVYDNPGFTKDESKNEKFNFPLKPTENEEYDSINFIGGNLVVTVNSDFSAPIDYEMTIKSLIDKSSNQPVVLTGTLTSSSPSESITKALSQYKGDFSKMADGSATRNNIVVELSYVVHVNENSQISAEDGVNFSFAIVDADYDLVYGDVGQREIDINFQLMNLNFFDSFKDGDLIFDSPRFSFVFENSFGFPVGMNFSNIAAVTQKGQIIPLEGAAANSTVIVDGPEINDIGGTLTKSFVLDKTNSNVAELVSSKPSKVILEVKSVSNPDEAPQQYNFVTENSELNASVLLELPLIVNINQLVSTQNVSFDFGEDLENATKMTMRLVSENSLPLGGDIQMVFKDDDGEDVLVVNERAYFDGATVGSDGRIVEPSIKTVDISFSEEDVKLLQKATNIDLISSLSSTNADAGDIVKFFEDYELKIKLAIQADVDLKTSGN